MLAYKLFVWKDKLPHEVYAMSPGEKVISEAFFQFEMEQKQEMLEEMRG